MTHDDTIPCAPISVHIEMAHAYIAEVRRAAQRRPSLPLDHSTPPAMVTT